jgi:alpha-methylacyl-CoA racemase
MPFSRIGVEMGPLKNLKIIEFAGIGPGPFCAMMLSDMGADIIRLERKGAEPRYFGAKFQVLNRGRLSAGIDLKNPEGKKAALRLIDQADALLEGFRPGVMERLGFGPDICLNRNPKLVYGRITGWGQNGSLAQAAGHDINYIAISGALHSFGRRGEKPVPPLNLVGDFGGGGMLLAFGMVCALFEARQSGLGQVVDASVVDGSAALMASIFGAWSSGTWKDERGVNRLDTGAHYYDTYETADGKYISIGSIEPQFYALMVQKAGVEDEGFHPQTDEENWPRLKDKLVEVFKTKTRDEWCEIMLGTDVCFAPVLSLEEAVHFPPNVERKTFIDMDGVVHPTPAPRLSRTPPEIQGPPSYPGADTKQALKEWGFSDEDIVQLQKSGAI